MRIPYVPDAPKFGSEEDAAVLQRMVQRRGDSGLIALDRALLHAPQIADGWYELNEYVLSWNSFFGAIRTHSSLPASIRELAICRIASLNKAWYEWSQHAPLLRQTSALSETAMRFVLDALPTHRDDGSEIPLDARHRVVLQYTDASTIDVDISDALFSKLKSFFSEQEIIEIAATVSAYNGVSRFLVALNVGETNGRKPDK